jgi:hypothetical protein
VCAPYILSQTIQYDFQKRKATKHLQRLCQPFTWVNNAKYVSPSHCAKALKQYGAHNQLTLRENTTTTIILLAPLSSEIGYFAVAVIGSGSTPALQRHNTENSKQIFPE